MNVLKNMEAIFLATVAIAASAALMSSASEAQAKSSPRVVSVSADIPVIVVSAKRMTPEEKIQSLKNERTVAAVQRANRSII